MNAVRQRSVVQTQRFKPGPTHKRVLPSAIPDDEPLTPVVRVGDVWLKRDDLFTEPGLGITGAKARFALTIGRREKQNGYVGLAAGLHRLSSIPNVIAHCARYLQMGALLHVAYARDDWQPGMRTEFHAAIDAGADVVMHSDVAYPNVIRARARGDAARRSYYFIRNGLEDADGIAQLAGQVRNVPDEARRIVISAGSGVMTSGVLWGLYHFRLPHRVVVVCVGQDPRPVIEAYGPPDWRSRVEFVPAQQKFGQAAKDTYLTDVPLDPIFEAKCLPFIKPDDLFWVVARRSQMPLREGVK